jgi:hypothetical protein
MGRPPKLTPARKAKVREVRTATLAKLARSI